MSQKNLIYGTKNVRMNYQNRKLLPRETLSCLNVQSIPSDTGTVFKVAQSVMMYTVIWVQWKINLRFYMFWIALLFIFVTFKQGIYNYIPDKTTSAEHRPIFSRYSVVNICDTLSVITHDKSTTTLLLLLLLLLLVYTLKIFNNETFNKGFWKGHQFFSRKYLTLLSTSLC
jgi:hypothetical protein